MAVFFLVAGPVLCAALAIGALALAWLGGRSTARALTPPPALRHLLAKLRGHDERVSTQTFPFDDLVGCTTLTEERGNHHAARVMNRFCRSVRRLLAEHRAYERRLRNVWRPVRLHRAATPVPGRRRRAEPLPREVPALAGAR